MLNVKASDGRSDAFADFDAIHAHVEDPCEKHTCFEGTHKNMEDPSDKIVATSRLKEPYKRVSRLALTN